MTRLNFDGYAFLNKVVCSYPVRRGFPGAPRGSERFLKKDEENLSTGKLYGLPWGGDVGFEPQDKKKHLI